MGLQAYRPAARFVTGDTDTAPQSATFHTANRCSQLYEDTTNDYKQEDNLNWFNKIKELTSKHDKSPELKKGDIKQIPLFAVGWWR